jgi:serine protease Do
MTRSRSAVRTSLILLAASTAMLALPQQAAFIATANAQQGPESVADLAAELLDSVVNISTTQTISSGGDGGQPARPRGQAPEGSPFQEFFDEFFNEDGPGDGQQRGRTEEVNSLGSGFVLDAEQGIVVTNNHVIADADKITVNFNDGTSLDAELVGRDQKTDIAVLKVDPAKHKLKAVKLGDSDAARIGDWVMAIGNPFGLGGSVTVGIISAQNRNINAGPYDRFIQTDAAINRGNSGGPLFNMDGEVIGINTAIISPSGGSIGIGFSIPSELAAGVIAQLREFGETRRGYLGVRIQPVTDDIAESMGLDSTRGVMISGIIENGPVADGTLQSGDIILSFDGRAVNEPRELSSAVAESPVGTEVDVKILRKGKEMDVKVTLGRLEDGETQLAAGTQSDESAAAAEEAPVLGMTLSAITPELKEKFQLADDLKGVVVSGVEEGSPAAGKGVRAGDVITEIAQEAVDEPGKVAEVLERLKTQGRKNALLMIASNTGELRFITIRID